MVCKLQNRSEILEELWQSGWRFCSTDCNAGIILGFSLCGDEGKSYFKKILYNSRWEADSTAISTAHYTYLGSINQHFSLIQFFNELLTVDDEEKQEQGLQVLLTMLHYRIDDYIHGCPDTIMDLYHGLFSWQEQNTLVDLATQHQLEGQAYKLRDLMEIKLNEELIMKHC